MKNFILIILALFVGYFLARYYRLKTDIERQADNAKQSLGLIKTSGTISAVPVNAEKQPDKSFWLNLNPFSGSITVPTIRRDAPLTFGITW